MPRASQAPLSNIKEQNKTNRGGYPASVGKQEYKKFHSKLGTNQLTCLCDCNCNLGR